MICSILVVAAIVLILLIRRNHVRAKAEGAKARESLEIQIEDPSQPSKFWPVTGSNPSYELPAYTGGSTAGRSAERPSGPELDLRNDRSGESTMRPVDPKSFV